MSWQSLNPPRLWRAQMRLHRCPISIRRVVGSKTFYLRDGIWKDVGYPVDDMTLDYKFGSERYFRLVANYLK